MSIHKIGRIWPEISVHKQKSSPLRAHAAIRIIAQPKVLPLGGHGLSACCLEELSNAYAYANTETVNKGITRLVTPPGTVQ